MISERREVESIERFYDRQWSAGSVDIFSLAFRDAVGYSYTLLEGLRGKKVLEVGCGSGEQAVYFALQGAEVTVIDISSESLNVVEKLALREGVTIRGEVMDAEAMRFAAEAFDVVYINSVLMHVDCAKVMEQCRRVLCSGGKLVVVEPLQYGLFVQGYRLFSSYKKMRPRYMTLKMFREGGTQFSSAAHTEFYFFSCLLLPVFFTSVRFLHRLFYVVAKFDEVLFRVLPFLRRLAWVSVWGYGK